MTTVSIFFLSKWLCTMQLGRIPVAGDFIEVELDKRMHQMPVQKVVLNDIKQNVQATVYL